MSSVTPMIKQYLLTKEQYPDCILLYRLGDFYEMFFEDAQLASRELDIMLTGRDCGMSERAPMCGVPYHSVDGYIKKLIEKGYKVAICEQLSDPALSKGLVDRDVIRVVTPGTVIEENIIEAESNRYILCLTVDTNAIGLAWCDVSTGEFFVDSLPTNLIASDILSQIHRIAPAEILTDETTLKQYGDQMRGAKVLISTLGNWAFSQNTAVEALLNHFHVRTLAGFGISEKSLEVRAAGALMQYLHQTQKNTLNHINAIRLASRSEIMELDTATRRNLELTAPIMGGGKKNTLLGVLDRTKTPQGSRLLKQWIEHPLQQKDAIESRLSAVKEFFDQFAQRKALTELLSCVYDLERLCGKIAYGTLHARDALAIAKTLKQIPQIREEMASFTSPMLCDISKSLPHLEALAQEIDNAIIEDPPLSIKEGDIIKPGYNERVDELKEASSNGRQWLMALEEKEKESTGIRNLKVGYNRVFGFYIEVSKSQLGQVPYRYVRRQTLANGERFITEELKELEENILGADEKRIRLEQSLFLELREKINEHIDELQAASRAIACVDVLLSLSNAAYEHSYIMPSINEDGELQIKDGRHPIVELSVSGFVPNDVYLNRTDSQFHLITGPNMSGKSTFMRQVAIIVLMAHIGSFVPAKSADICLVDRIFTRVGASDDLASGRSTFMVEMVELANILNHATDKSLIILDEIGRGTSTYDGLCIAWAASEYICERLKGAKTLFATHYHELIELQDRVQGVQNFCVLAHETESDIVFLHRVISGGTDKSFGVAVAQMAGVPKTVIDRAKELMIDMQKQKEELPFNKTNGGYAALPLFQDAEIYPLLQELSSLEIGQMTPLEALNQLNLYKNRAGKLL